MDTEQCLGTMYQGVVRWERYITSLQFLDNFILLTFIHQCQFLRIVYIRSICTIAEREIHLITNARCHIQLHFLIEIKVCCLPVSFRDGWVVRKFIVDTCLQACTTVRTDSHTTRAEYLLSRAEVEMHIGKIELLLAFVYEQGVVSHLEVITQQLTCIPRCILLRSHQCRGTQEVITQLRTHPVVSTLLVILSHIILQIVRVSQVQRRLHLLLSRRVIRLLHLHMRKRIHRHTTLHFSLH